MPGPAYYKANQEHILKYFGGPSENGTAVNELLLSLYL